jgi:hypothetical protein
VSLFDITTGTNDLAHHGGACRYDYLCTAKKGYDVPTGLGAPMAPATSVVGQAHRSGPRWRSSRGTVIPPPQPDQAHRLPWSIWRRRHQRRARHAHQDWNA